MYHNVLILQLRKPNSRGVGPVSKATDRTTVENSIRTQGFCPMFFLHVVRLLHTHTHICTHTLVQRISMCVHVYILWCKAISWEEPRWLCSSPGSTVRSLCAPGPLVSIDISFFIQIGFSPALERAFNVFKVCPTILFFVPGGQLLWTPPPRPSTGGPRPSKMHCPTQGSQ